MRQSVWKIGLAWLLATAVCMAVFGWLTSDTAAGSSVVCVVPPGGDTGPFPACGQVVTSVQTAVDTAVDGDEIWVAAGVYTDIHTLPPNSWTQMVYVTKTVTIRGGYRPPFSDPPDYAANITVLDAQGQAIIFRLLTPDVTVEGLHLTGGNGVGGAVLLTGSGVQATLNQNVMTNNTGAGGGGAIFSFSGHLRMNENIIRDNIGNLSGSEVMGGGITLIGSRAWLTGNQVLSNTAVLTLSGSTPSAWGGGLYATDSQLTMTQNIFQGNVTARLVDASSYDTYVYGGGLFLQDSQAILDQNIVQANTAVLSQTRNSYFTYAYGGGIGLSNSRSVLSQNQILGNQAAAHVNSGYGGGIFIYSGIAYTLTGNLIAGNKAVGACAVNCYDGIGGGLAWDAYQVGEPITRVVHLEDNWIQNNIGAETGYVGLGGGVALLGDTLASENARFSGRDNVIISNTGVMSGNIGAGGGLFVSGIEGSLVGNQILHNTAVVTGNILGIGGGLFTWSGPIHLAQNQINENVAAVYGRGYGGGISVGDDSTFYMENNVLNGNQANTSGGGLFTTGSNSNLSWPHNTIAANTSGDGTSLVLASWDVINEMPAQNVTLALTNTILVSHSVGISVSGGHTARLNGMLWYNTPTTVTAGVTATVTSANAITGDPAFAADGYHLTAVSAAIGQGVPSAVRGDIDNEGRPAAAPAIGVDEFWPYKVYLPLSRH